MASSVAIVAWVLGPRYGNGAVHFEAYNAKIAPKCDILPKSTTCNEQSGPVRNKM
jgi:hypothetical protein